MATDDGKNQSTTDIQKHLNQLIDEETATHDACELEHSISTESFLANCSELAHRKDEKDY